MAYTKKVWKDAPDTSTPINAANLNHMEDGIATADVNAQNALDRLDDVDDEITQINSNLTPSVTEPSEYGGTIRFTKYGHLVICDINGWDSPNGQTGQTVPVELRPSYNTYGTAHKSADTTGTTLRYYEGYLQFLDEGVTSYKTGIMYGQISWFI